MSRLHGVAIDCAHPASLARWWAGVLGYRVRPYTDQDVAWLREHGYEDPEQDPAVAIDDPEGRGPTIWFNLVPERKTTKNRVHLDVAADPDDLVARGAKVAVPEDGDRSWTVLWDPEGNEFCASVQWIATRS